jgi:hypothetical protein
VTSYRFTQSSNVRAFTSSEGKRFAIDRRHISSVVDGWRPDRAELAIYMVGDPVPYTVESEHFDEIVKWWADQ